MKKWIAAAGLVLLLLAGVYIGSPFYAVSSLRSAARSGDSDRIEAMVDFPAVRGSLKSQLSAAMVTKMQSDPEVRNNPFAALGAVLLPGIVDRLVDSFVTPEGIAAMMRGRKPTDPDKSGADPEMKSHAGYVGLDRFRVRLRNVRTNQDGPSFLFERRGFASWKLIRVELPRNLLDTGR